MFFRDKLKTKVEWFSVNDKLPAKWETVLATNVDGSTFSSWRDDDGDFMYDGKECSLYFENVSHWCYFPKSPNDN